VAAEILTEAKASGSRVIVQPQDANPGHAMFYVEETRATSRKLAGSHV
jgi:hypothetical protein